MGPERAPTGLVVGHFTDPEGNLIGVAGPASRTKINSTLLASPGTVAIVLTGVPLEIRCGHPAAPTLRVGFVNGMPYR